MPSVRDVRRALTHVRAAMPRAKQVLNKGRSIRLGLERITRVVPEEQSWAGVHVGGTNGKGSICALLAGMFKLAGISHGAFISPAMPERHNGIMINDRYVNKRMYELERQHVEDAFRRVATRWAFSLGEDAGDLTPFELDTATAFRVFDKMHVKYGIVEVGMGGATDATNAMRQKSVTVISKIDLDHREYLGDTIEEIAKVKAGIMKMGVPCIVDDSNTDSVIKVLGAHAVSIGTQISVSSNALPLIEELDLEKFKLEDYELQNLLSARLAFRHLFPHLDVDVNKLLSMKPYLPGRKEYVGVSGFTDGLRQTSILVDGAHNMLGVEALAKYVETRVRTNDEPITWVMGLSASESKPFAEMIEALLRPQDNVAFVEYTQGPTDPPAVPAELGSGVAKVALKDESQLYDGEPDIASAVQWACSKAGEGPVIVTGSLYLVRDLYQLDGIERQIKIGTRRPGRSQLWHYTQLSQQRALTAEEEQEYKKARRHWRLSPLRNPAFRTTQEEGPPQRPIVSDRVRELQRTAAHHKKQVDGYRAAIASIENDSNEGKVAGASSSDLSAVVDDLKRRHAEHNKTYNSTMFKLRGYVANPDQKHMSHEKIYGRPEKRRGRIATILAQFEEDEPQEQEHMAATPSSGTAIKSKILQPSRNVLGKN
ncbi:Dihydrofolate synthase [Purpureocillium takamizusanense]|uniref:Dihydrofolate synthase n=1 Tax=Purpureocillium takamizusanense TaxID=2060973 RepID=A0A9Q8VCR5_9HYPO|nr:Dihydrofolate synthase [Purpureocillium takamizusanense]UNI20943.1 Dihydrofolate synthase [Purpureocillium takamizusanense]